MTSPSSETETYEITLSIDEQWVVHAVLADAIDDAIDDGETPPTWATDLLESIEAGNGSETLTGYQARQLAEELTATLDGDVPDADHVHGSNLLERLEQRLESDERSQ